MGGQDLFAGSDHGGYYEGGNSGADVDGEPSGVVHDAEGAEPSFFVHDPVGEGGVDEDDPCAAEDEHGGEFDSFGVGADYEGGGEHGYGHLEDGEEGFGDGSVEGFAVEAFEDDRSESSDDSGLAVVEGQGVADDHPQGADEGGYGYALHDDRQGGLGPDLAGVEHGQARHGHHQNQGCGGQQPSGGAGVQHLPP